MREFLGLAGVIADNTAQPSMRQGLSAEPPLAALPSANFIRMSALRKSSETFARAAKDCFPPFLTRSASGPFPPFTVHPDAALQLSRCCRSRTTQHFGF